MIIAVASGKGGTGKTTVALALAQAADRPVNLLDLDVEEPNAALFLGGQKPAETAPVIRPLPAINKDQCIGCVKCADICRYNAIAIVKGKALIFNELCHSCGGCAIVCPVSAITEGEETIGEINKSAAGQVTLYEGKINIGHTATPETIRQVKRNIDYDKLNVLDCPPGSACPMVAAVTDADYVVLVTEPTPFGLNDLAMAALTIQEMGLPSGVIINKSDGPYYPVEDYCREYDIPLLAVIPEETGIAKAYSEGIPLLNAAPILKPIFEGVLSDIYKFVEDKK
jgi:MinD superfamily P-loop ATPase